MAANSSQPRLLNSRSFALRPFVARPIQPI
jgi:hypothetical protein